MSERNDHPGEHEMSISVDPKEFRTVLGHFPTGVTVVAGADGEEAFGLAIGSFFSVSLEPPLVGFCVGNESDSWKRVAATGSFSVNILSEHQMEVSNTFASKSEDKFAAVEWTESAHTGSPLITDAIAHLDCELEATYPGGDHEIVIGRVRSLDLHRENHGPLIFFKGSYSRHEKI